MSIEWIFTRRAELCRLKQGSLQRYLDLYVERLAESGYGRERIRRRLWCVSHLSKYMEEKQISTSDLDERVAAAFLSVRSRYGRIDKADGIATREFLAMLRETGICSPPSRIESAKKLLLEEFRQHLVQNRGLATKTVDRHLSVARQLHDWSEARISQWSELTPDHIVDFVERHVDGWAPRSISTFYDSVRTLCRYLRLRGDSTDDLTRRLPRIARWRDSTLPRSLPYHDVQRVLDHCDHGTAMGRRDYAILTTLACLGLRACEVVALKLEDIDWHAGLLHLPRTKSGCAATLPLPDAVGKAISSYLHNGRPRSDSRNVFLRSVAPYRELGSSSSIVDIVHSALRRANVQAPRGAAHLFRHGLATRMLDNGASLRLIGELLRHQHPDTTRVYAKVDVQRLRSLALPWPGDAP
ncbi:site-specific integrase [Burkholderia cepacia]|uniref:site-specific integrase n=1 Tax=Burkholderia cepacia TaxID=292 RepID=UPI002AB60A35|nr:site-specific integrase [Burkholderia cepacia]